MNSNLFHALLIAAGWMLVAAATPGSIELAMLTLGGLLPVRRRRQSATSLPRTAIVIPAHDEESGIARTIASLHADIGADPGVSLIVIADNCTDATADRARAAGARAVVRHDPPSAAKATHCTLPFSVCSRKASKPSS